MVAVFATGEHILLVAQTPPAIALVSAADPTVSRSPAPDSSDAILTRDGRWIAFVSSPTNSGPLSALDVYLYDRQSGRTTLVSARADGLSGGDDHSTGASLSDDGTLVAFESRAKNLVTNRVSGVGDIYVRNMNSGTTALVSVTPSGEGGNGPSTRASITPDGRFVVFQSSASDLVANDTNGATDIFVRDLTKGTATLVSVNSQGTGSAATTSNVLYASTEPMITPDGRYVAFRSQATDLTAKPVSSSYSQIYVRDLVLGTNILVSASPNGEPASDDAEGPLLSDDGHYVVFQSRATNLIAGIDRRNVWSIYRRDLPAGTTELVAQEQPSSTPLYLFARASLSASADGRVVSFAYNQQVYVWTDSSATSVMVSTNASGEPGSGSSDLPVLSEDGRKMAFISAATNLVAGAFNGQYQLYARDVASGSNILVSASTNAASGSSSDCLFPELSADGHVAAFQAFDSDLIGSRQNRASTVFERDLSTGALQSLGFVGNRIASVTPDSFSSLPDNPVSRDGRYVLFTSTADDLVPNDKNDSTDVFVRDGVLGTNILVSVNALGTASGNGNSQFPAMTPDGRFVAFLSSATDLIGDDNNGLEDVFVRDLVTGITTGVSFRPAGYTGQAVAYEPPVISPDGRYVAFNIGPNGIDDILLRDTQSGTTTAVTSGLDRSAGLYSLTPLAITTDNRLWYFWEPGPFGWSDIVSLYRYDIVARTNELVGGGTLTPAFTADGQFVAGETYDGRGLRTNLVWQYDAVRRAFQTLAVWTGTNANAAPSSLSISSDGNLVAFVTAQALTPLDTNQVSDVYLADVRRPGVLSLVSVNTNGTSAGRGASDSARLSGDGRFVTFRSTASDLGPVVTSSVPNIFVRDLERRETRLVSAIPAGGAGNNLSVNPWISLDGSTVVFASSASDLVAADFNDTPDIFAYRVPVVPAIHVRVLPFAPGELPTLVWNAEAGRHFRLQFKNQLSDAAWQDSAATPVPFGAGELSIQDTSAQSSPQRFYRIALLP